MIEKVKPEITVVADPLEDDRETQTCLFGSCYAEEGLQRKTVYM